MNTSSVTEYDLFRLHKEARNDSNRTRYTLAAAIAGAGDALDPRRVLARRIETEVADRLTWQGYIVTRTRHKERFDLLANGIRIECKAATWDGARYAAAMHGNRADCLVLACVDSATRYFVIPFDQVRGLTYVKITAHDPRDYCGRWTPFYEAWDILDGLVVAGRNAWQLSMW